MTEETVRRLVRFLKSFSKNWQIDVALAGGDPTAFSSFRDIITRLSSICNVSIVTHGGFFLLEDLEKFSFLDNIIIQFSIPSYDSDRYKYITGGNSFEKALESLLICKKLAIPTAISVVVTDVNQDDVSGMVHLAAETEARYVVLNRFLSAGRGAFYKNMYEVTDDAFSEILSEARLVANERGVRLLASGNNAEIRILKVKEPKFTISVDGSVRVCSLSDQTFGDLDDTPSVLLSRYKKFWQSNQTLDNCTCSITF